MGLTIHTSNLYQTLIRRGYLNQLGKQASALFREDGRAMITTDSNVGPLYARRATDSLVKAGFVPDVFISPVGEEDKRLSIVEQTYAVMTEQEMTRTDFIVTFSDDIIESMVDFATTIFLRGIGFIQIPTSLFTQVGSSVSGKTGVNLPQDKSLMGAFHQPYLAPIDPDTLAALLPRFFLDDMAETIRYGCIKSRQLFGLIRDNDLSKDPKVPGQMITECVDYRRHTTEDDELDAGEYVLLNFGYMLGHALEKYCAFGKLAHGEVVGIGTMKTSCIGEALGLTKSDTAEEISALLWQYYLPAEDDAPAESLIKAAAVDKEGMGGTFNLALPCEIDQPFVYPIPKQELLPIIIKEEEGRA